MTTRKLTVNSERLAELSAGELDSVVGAGTLAWIECTRELTNDVIYTCRCLVSGAVCA